MYFVYVLQSERTRELYKGMTNNLDRRLKQHNNDENVGTRGKGPWVLVLVEKCKTLSEARKREEYFKSGVGREYLYKILNK